MISSGYYLASSELFYKSLIFFDYFVLLKSIIHHEENTVLPPDSCLPDHFWTFTSHFSSGPDVYQLDMGLSGAQKGC